MSPNLALDMDFAGYILKDTCEVYSAGHPNGPLTAQFYNELSRRSSMSCMNERRRDSDFTSGHNIHARFFTEFCVAVILSENAEWKVA